MSVSVQLKISVSASKAYLAAGDSVTAPAAEEAEEGAVLLVPESVRAAANCAGTEEEEEEAGAEEGVARHKLPVCRACPVTRGERREERGERRES